MNEDIEKIASKYEMSKEDKQSLTDLVDRTFLMGIKEGWEQSGEGHNNEYVRPPNGKRLTEEDVLNKVIKDVFEGLNAKK